MRWKRNSGRQQGVRSQNQSQEPIAESRTLLMPIFVITAFGCMNGVTAKPGDGLAPTVGRCPLHLQSERRRPPRGVPKNEYASQHWYDVWLPNVAPTSELMKLGRVFESEKDWAAFVQKCRAEMAEPEKSRVLDLLAALSHDADFSVGCYCENEAHCHRSILRELLVERKAKLE